MIKKNNIQEKYTHKINRGNGSVNDALADVADLLVNTAKDNNKDQQKNFKWLVVSVIVGIISLIVSILK